MGDLVTARSVEEEQELYADALLKHGSLEKAARALGMTPTEGKRLIQTKAGIRYLKTKAQAEVSTLGLARATRTLMDCMAPTMSPTVRLKAAALAFALAGVGPQTEGELGALEELTADQLASFIKQADGLLGAKALAAKPIGGSAA